MSRLLLLVLWLLLSALLLMTVSALFSRCTHNDLKTPGKSQLSMQCCLST